MDLKNSQNNQKLKFQKGITLIALIITVIVMLILAGVSISILTGADGLFSQTENAKEKYNNSVQVEANQIEKYKNDIETYLNGVSIQSQTAPIASKVQVGDYINYDAGNWEAAGTGYILGQSRNTNATAITPGSISTYEGWRIWDIDGATGIVKLISVGHPEVWSHAKNEAVTRLQNKDCSMYLNEYSNSACVLTGEELVASCNKNFGINIAVTSGAGQTNSNLFSEISEENSRKSLFVIGARYFVATKANSPSMYYIGENGDLSYTYTGDGQTRRYGIRIIITLNEDVKVMNNVGDGSLENKWQLAL